MKLSEAKRLIEAANDGNGYAEIDAGVPHDEDWKHLGGDYFVSPDGDRVAGPSGGDPTRTCTRTRAAVVTTVQYDGGEHRFYARTIAADAASGDLVFEGVPTDEDIRDAANEELAIEVGDFSNAEVVWE